MGELICAVREKARERDRDREWDRDRAGSRKRGLNKKVTLHYPQRYLLPLPHHFPSPGDGAQKSGTDRTIDRQTDRDGAMKYSAK